MKNEYGPWKKLGITELEYFKQRYIGGMKDAYAEGIEEGMERAAGIADGMAEIAKQYEKICVEEQRGIDEWVLQGRAVSCSVQIAEKIRSAAANCQGVKNDRS